MKLTAKLNFIDTNFKSYSFSVSQANNDNTNYSKLQRLAKKLKKQFKTSYMPIYEKEFNDNKFFSLQGKLRNGIRKPIKGSLYDLTFEIHCVSKTKLQLKITKLTLAKEKIGQDTVQINIDDLDAPKLIRETTSIEPHSSDDDSEASDSD